MLWAHQPPPFPLYWAPPARFLLQIDESIACKLLQDTQAPILRFAGRCLMFMDLHICSAVGCLEVLLMSGGMYVHRAEEELEALRQ